MILGLIELLVILLVPMLAVAALLGQRRAPAPNQLLIVHGRRAASGRGYTVCDGPSFVLPVLEAAELWTFDRLPIGVRRSMKTHDGQELEVEIAAVVSRPKDPERLTRLLDLFCGQSTIAIAELAEDAIAGSAARVVAMIPADHVLADSRAVSEQTELEAQWPLEVLGLELESLTLTPNPGAPSRG